MPAKTTTNMSSKNDPTIDARQELAELVKRKAEIGVIINDFHISIMSVFPVQKICPKILSYRNIAISDCKHELFVVGNVGELRTTNLRIRRLLFRRHTTVRQHNKRLGPIFVQQQNHQFQSRQTKQKIQRSWTFILQIIDHFNGRKKYTRKPIVFCPKRNYLQAVSGLVDQNPEKSKNSYDLDNNNQLYNSSS